MGRCPTHLNVDDLDRLAASLGLTLTDEAAEVLGEILETLARQLLLRTAPERSEGAIDSTTILRSAQQTGMKVRLKPDTFTVTGVDL